MSEEKASLDLSEILLRLADAALHTHPTERVIADLSTALNALGFEIARTQISTSALHTAMRAYSLHWYADREGERFEMPHGMVPTPAWQESPLHHMLVNDVRVMEQRLDRPNAPFTYPVFQEFADMGMTDWVAYSEGFNWFGDGVPGGQFGIITSWTTRREGGFHDHEKTILKRLMRPLTVAIKTSFLDSIANDVLGAYLGRDAAMRVLSGAITRGEVTQIPAVVMMADLKGFTQFSNEKLIGDVVARLNDTFDVIAGAVNEHAGHVLKFVGDGVLSIFLLEEMTREQAVGQALEAAAAIRQRLPAHVGVDIGLSVGDVHYGNVGAAGRLDFTAIGPAVNEAARLEAMCAQLGHGILLSGAVASAAGAWADRLIPLGPQAMRGFDQERPVFALP